MTPERSSHDEGWQDEAAAWPILEPPPAFRNQSNVNVIGICESEGPSDAEEAVPAHEDRAGVHEPDAGNAREQCDDSGHNSVAEKRPTPRISRTVKCITCAHYKALHLKGVCNCCGAAFLMYKI